MYRHPIDPEEDLAGAAPTATERRIGPHFEIVRGSLRFANPTRAATSPTAWIEAFRVAIANDCAVSEQVQQIIRQNASRYSADDFVATRSERLQIRKLLHPRPGLHGRLIELWRSGLLTLIFPELGACPHEAGHPHLVYAFDERDLAPIARLELLRVTRTGTRARFRALLDEVHAPELLTLALLLDRGEPGRHHDRHHDEVARVRAVRPALERLQLTADARQSVEFLVSHRRMVTRLAFRCDAADPAVIAELAGAAATDQRLKMVCLMALAYVPTDHAKSFGWREEALWRLFVPARHRVMLGDRAPLLQVAQSNRAVAVAGRPEDISETEVTEFLDGVTDRYLAVFGVSSVYDHVRLARSGRPGDVHTALERHDDVWELTIVGSRARQPFVRAVGVLTRFGMDIHRAHAITTPDDLGLDLIEFSDPRDVLSRTPAATSDLDRALASIMADERDVDALEDRVPLASAHRPPTVSIAHGSSDTCSVVNIDAADARGVLFDVCRAVADLGGAVTFALASTGGDSTHQTLHVTKHGRRLSETDRVVLAARLSRPVGDVLRPTRAT